MEAAGYVTLSRQSGLAQEMRIVANNIANAATAGFRQEGLIFSEFIQNSPDHSSVSMSRAGVRNTSLAQGPLTQTNGTFDFAIEGDGFFLVETPQGTRLTRAGNFSPNSDGDLVSVGGHRVLDAGGAPLFVPGGTQDIRLATDGTLSSGGRVLGRIGVFQPSDPKDMTREDGVLFRSDKGTDPVDQPKLLQGFLEGSNVDPILQVARMVEIQRGYELGQSFLENEDKRIRNAVKSLIR
jgi:flagellar basal-body rod protein FlgF